MSPPDLAVLAEGDLPTDEHWIVRAGGTGSHYYTFLETIHPDGHRDEGGMGGPPLYPGSPVATHSDPALSFFAPLLPRTAQLVSLTPVDASGQVMEPQDLSFHEAAWQRFPRQHGATEA